MQQEFVPELVENSIIKSFASHENKILCFSPNENNLRKEIESDARICPGSTRKAKNTIVGDMFFRAFILTDNFGLANRETGRGANFG